MKEILEKLDRVCIDDYCCLIYNNNSSENTVRFFQNILIEAKEADIKETTVYYAVSKADAVKMIQAGCPKCKSKQLVLGKFGIDGNLPGAAEGPGSPFLVCPKCRYIINRS